MRSTTEISREIAHILSACDSTNYPFSQLPKHICAINDILQKRSDRTIDELLDELKQKGDESDAEKINGIEQEIKDYQSQCALLIRPYSGVAVTMEEVGLGSIEDETQPIITQEIYDKAARLGFPADFFRRAYFQNVTIYCLPDYVCLHHSVFANCDFAVCRIREAVFDGDCFFSSRFHGCDIAHATFRDATLAHTHFHDCSMQDASFQQARLRSCNTIDCTMGSVNYQGATLDGCTYGRVQAYDIRNLHRATITMGGATNEEVERNRKAIYAALRPESKERQPMPHKKRETR